MEPGSVPEPQFASAAASVPGSASRIVEADSLDALPSSLSKWQARRNLLRHRAETDRLRVLVEFLSHPIHAHGGADPDPDIITAYNLAVEAALQGIRRGALSELDDTSEL
jgi:hypothetical protein